MPRRVERDITSLILATSPLKIRSWMSGELSMISIAAMRPEPASRGTSRCEMSALMFSDRSISSWSRRSSGKKLTTRSSAWLALLACRVASTRCPVSENWMPYSMVSRSRISPIRITSGAWRRVFLSAECQESVSTPSSRCVIPQPLWVCTYSTGSSMVTRCPRVLSLRYPTIVASVVDLPEPVPPTTITSPRLLSTTSFRIGGRSSSSKVGILALIRRIAADGPLLHEGADAEAADAGRGDGEVAFLGGVELAGLPVVHDGAHQRRGLLGGQRPLALRPDLAVDLDGGRKAGGDEQVRRLLLRHPPEEILHQLDGLVAIHVRASAFSARPWSAPCSAPLPF